MGFSIRGFEITFPDSKHPIKGLATPSSELHHSYPQKNILILKKNQLVWQLEITKTNYWLIT